MSRLIDDLLDVSRTTRGATPCSTETVTLATLCERAVEASDPLISGRQQHLSMDTPRNSPS